MNSPLPTCFDMCVDRGVLYTFAQILTLWFRVNAIFLNNLVYELREVVIEAEDDEESELESIRFASLIEPTARTIIPLNYIGGSGLADSHQTFTTGTSITEPVFPPQEAPAFIWPNDGDDREEVVKEYIEMDELDGVQWGNGTDGIGNDDTMSQCSGFTTNFAPV